MQEKTKEPSNEMSNFPEVFAVNVFLRNEQKLRIRHSLLVRINAEIRVYPSDPIPVKCVTLYLNSAQKKIYESGKNEIYVTIPMSYSDLVFTRDLDGFINLLPKSSLKMYQEKNTACINLIDKIWIPGAVASIDIPN